MKVLRDSGRSVLMLNASLLNSVCVMYFMIIPVLSAMAAPDEHIVILFFVAAVCGFFKYIDGK